LSRSDTRPGLGEGALRPQPEALALEVAASVDPAAWDAEVARLGGGCFHTHRWVNFSAAHSGATAVYFRWRDPGGTGQAVAVGTTSGFRVAGVRVTTTLSVGSLPATREPALRSCLVSDLATYARRRGVGSFSLHSFGTPWEVPDLAALGFVTSRRWEFVLDLAQTREALWAGLHSKKRNLIRKAEKRGLRIGRGGGLRDLLRFREISDQTYRRKRAQGIEFPPVASEDYYRALHQWVVEGGLGRLYMAFANETCIAGAFLVGFAGQAYYVLSAATDEGLSAAAPDLLLWTAIRDYQADGYRSFNFGGVSEAELNGEPLESSGLYHFKARFSPAILPCQKAVLEVCPARLRVARMLRRLAARVRRT
jgi:hypothetical protein